MKVQTPEQYLARYKKRGQKTKTRRSDTLGGSQQPKWDGSARVESSAWVSSHVMGEKPTWSKRIGR